MWTQRVRHGVDVWRSSFLSSFIASLCRVKKIKIVFLLSWRTVCVHFRVLVWCLFPSLLHNSGNNRKTTLSWVHKQLATPAHAFFYIDDGSLKQTNVDLPCCNRHLRWFITALGRQAHTKNLYYDVIFADCVHTHKLSNEYQPWISNPRHPILILRRVEI